MTKKEFGQLKARVRRLRERWVKLNAQIRETDNDMYWAIRRHNNVGADLYTVGEELRREEARMYYLEGSKGAKEFADA